MIHRTVTTTFAATAAATVFLTSLGAATAHAKRADPDDRPTHVATVTTSDNTPLRSWTLVQIGYRAKLDRMPI
jgi:hypothetical protein